MLSFLQHWGMSNVVTIILDLSFKDFCELNLEKKKKKKKPELCEEAGVPLMEFLVNTK